MSDQSRRADILSVEEEAVLVTLREILARLREREHAPALASFTAAVVTAGGRRLDVGNDSEPALFSLAEAHFTIRPASDAEGTFDVFFLLDAR